MGTTKLLVLGVLLAVQLSLTLGKASHTNPCLRACGTNANCKTKNHVPSCSCPPGYTGDPLTHCRRFNPELCQPSPCGVNTQCEVVNNVPTCKCLSGYHGSPIAGCRHECENDVECGLQFACIEFKCQNPCLQCGINAACDFVRNHAPVCKCPKNYVGNPLISCKPECTQHSDCPPGKPACYYNTCKNPCDGVCGTNANCKLRDGITPVCSCPRDMTGDPFLSCRPFTKEDLCEPNPCGANAKCQPGYDKNNKERPVCTCHPGYIGDPITGCVRKECTQHSDCPQGKPVCYNNSCKNACDGVCGINAKCELKNGIIPLCSCPRDMTGDPFLSCRSFTKEDLCEPNPCGANAKCQPGYDKNYKEPPVCTCHSGYIGDPITGCVRKECTQHSDCPSEKPTCYYNSCRNPCDGVYGINANCELRNGITPVCSCPRIMTGDPFVSCRSFTKEELCEPNPCGVNAKCQAGYDKNNEERPVCTCHPEYIGNPITGCVRD